MTDVDIRGEDISDDDDDVDVKFEETAIKDAVTTDFTDEAIGSNGEDNSCPHNPESDTQSKTMRLGTDGGEPIHDTSLIKTEPSAEVSGDMPVESRNSAPYSEQSLEVKEESFISGSATSTSLKEEHKKKDEDQDIIKVEPAKEESEGEELDYTEDSIMEEPSSPISLEKIPSAQDISDGELSDSQDSEKKDDGEEGEITEKEEGELEEGEIEDSDDDDVSLNSTAKKEKEPREVCKHYLRGNCSWDRCNFAHPPGLGGSQRRRKSVSPPPVRAPARRSINDRGPPRPTSESTSSAPKNETAWERGLREARELMKKANQKKQDDPEFEEKRLRMPPSDEKDWKHYSDDENDTKSRPGRIPSLLELRMSPPPPTRNERERKDRYRGYDVPKDLGPQCIYPSGRPVKRSPPRRMRRESSNRSVRNVRSRSPPPRPGPDPMSDFSERSRSRSPPRRPVDHVSRRPLKPEDGPYDPWARKKKTSPSSRDSEDTRSRCSYSRSSDSSVSVDSRKRAPRSPPTGDISSYRIPKKSAAVERDERPWRADGDNNKRGNKGHRGRANMNNNGRARWDMSNPNKEKLGPCRVPNVARLSEPSSNKTPPPIDLEPRGAEAISDDEKSVSSASSHSRSSSSSSDSSSQSSSSSSSCSSRSRSKSNSPALPAKYRITNTDILEKETTSPEKAPISKKRHAAPPSPSPPPAKKKVIRPRSPSGSPPPPPPPPPREGTPPPPPKEKIRGLEVEKHRERGDKPQRKDRAPKKSKEEILEELRHVEEQLLRKRRKEKGAA